MTASGISYPISFNSSVHRTFQRWEQNGVLDQLWAVFVEECEELGGVDWQWQSADAAIASRKINWEWTSGKSG